MRFPFTREKHPPLEALKIPYHDQAAIQKLSNRIQQMLQRLQPNQDLVVVCIGTDRSTGDALGPLVGTALKRQYAIQHVYGTLSKPVHAMNLQDTLHEIMSSHFSPYILAIDACLGKLTSVGSIQFASGPIKPGAGVNKKLPAVGNAHITGVVNVSGFMEYFVLQNTRLHLVYEMSKVIASGIAQGITTYIEAAATVTTKFE